MANSFHTNSRIHSFIHRSTHPAKRETNSAHLDVLNLHLIQQSQRFLPSPAPADCANSATFDFFSLGERERGGCTATVVHIFTVVGKYQLLWSIYAKYRRLVTPESCIAGKDLVQTYLSIDTLVMTHMHSVFETIGRPKNRTQGCDGSTLRFTEQHNVDGRWHTNGQMVYLGRWNQSHFRPFLIGIVRIPT